MKNILTLNFRRVFDFRYAGSAVGVLAASVTLLIVCALPARAIEIQEVVSPKGIHAWLVEDDSVPLISMRFSFKGGTSQDPSGKEGLANLMTGLFDEGAGDLKSDAFQEKIDNLGAEMSFSATQDSVSGGIRMLAENRDAVTNLLALSVNKPRFDQDAIDRIRQQVVASIESSQRNPSTIASRKFSEVLYGNHPYARPDDGTVKSLQSITRDDLVNFHRKNFARDRLTIGVVGSINAKDLGALLDKVFGDLPAMAELVPVPDAKLALGTTTSLNFDMPQTLISFVYPAIPRKDLEFFAAYLMNHILGGGFTSRLYAEVREKRGLAYSVSSSMVMRDHVSALMISTATANEAELTKVRGAEIGMIFQEPMTSLNPVLTIGTQIEESFRLHRGLTGKQAASAAKDVLDRVRIPDAARRLKYCPNQLSGGMLQRVMIATALACNPRHGLSYAS